MEQVNDATNLDRSGDNKEVNLDGINQEDFDKIIDGTADIAQVEKKDDKVIDEDPEIDFGGETGKLKRSEAIKRMMLHKDYTVKTQAISEKSKILAQYEALDKFLQDNPDKKEAVEKLLKGESTQEEKKDLTEEIDNPAITKIVKEMQDKINNLEKKEQTREEKNAKVQLDNNLNEVKSWAKENFPTVSINDGELCAEALKLGTTDLKAAFKSLYFDEAVKLGKVKLTEELKSNSKLKVDANQDKGNGKETKTDEAVVVKGFNDPNFDKQMGDILDQT